jgi:hypothetical protein
MNLVEKQKDLLGFAHKVISFRMNVIKACKAKGIMPPTDEQISDYINDYGLHFEDFMADFTEHEGMFRCMTSYSPLEQKALDATLKLSDENLVILWNTFITESAIYGEDSHIYDLADEKESKFLGKSMTDEELLATCKLVTNDNARFIQWLSLNDKSIKVVKNVKDIITAFWGEIFERVMLYPCAYQFDTEVYCEGDGSIYFDDVFFPIIAEEVGYKVDGNKGTITKIEK